MINFDFDSPEAYTREGHLKVSKMLEEKGWTCVKGFIAYGEPKWEWIKDNDICVIRCGFLNEMWFENEEDAAAFKLRWT